MCDDQITINHDYKGKLNFNGKTHPLNEDEWKFLYEYIEYYRKTNQTFLKKDLFQDWKNCNKKNIVKKNKYKIGD